MHTTARMTMTSEVQSGCPAAAVRLRWWPYLLGEERSSLLVLAALRRTHGLVGQDADSNLVAHLTNGIGGMWVGEG